MKKIVRLIVVRAGVAHLTKRMKKELMVFHKEMLKYGWQLVYIDEDRKIVEYRMYFFGFFKSQQFTFKSIEYFASVKAIVNVISREAVCDLAIKLYEGATKKTFKSSGQKESE